MSPKLKLISGMIECMLDFLIALPDRLITVIENDSRLASYNRSVFFVHKNPICFEFESEIVDQQPNPHLIMLDLIAFKRKFSMISVSPIIDQMIDKK